MESISNPPTGFGRVDYYYHPDVIQGFNKTSQANIEKAGALGSLEDIQKLFIQSAKEVLPVVMGSIYANVVRLCLERTLLDTSDEEFIEKDEQGAERDNNYRPNSGRRQIDEVLDVALLAANAKR
ncbi:hypothetical protein OIDMADRAFT_60568 [Oidiodendron maius Zn]|uniref:Uncharacterized protein n=1 Tax=Oidiodendron maius (strain Zn) TaxID=913774 RepID=A0A0C3GU23_OIDMZ|nr:hypothetical protein OIDMADRAFT_60568 [Oidiodendron maius Zn]